MKKVIVIGCAGGGKSYFSKKLRDIVGLPLYHLDNIFWNQDGTTLEKPIFYEKLDEILALDEWIIDGNYGSTMERRMQVCDTVFFLDYPTDVCLSGIAERKGKMRDDIAWQEPLENDDAEFVEFIKGYNVNNRPRVIELLEKYSDKNIVIFKNRDDADFFLDGLNK